MRTTKVKHARVAEAIDRLAALFEYGALQASTDPAEFLDRVATEIVGLRALSESPEVKPTARFRLEGKGLIDTEGGLSLCTSCGKLPPHAGCQAICAACAPPTGACYCAGCTVSGKGAPAPEVKPTGEETSYDMSIHHNRDAGEWARAFVQTWGYVYPSQPAPSESWMLGWFANAMMAMHDTSIDGRARPAPSTKEGAPRPADTKENDK